MNAIKAVTAIKLAVLIFAMSHLLAAQESTGSILGIVKNVAGAVVPAAAISLKNVATGTVADGQTDSSGSYNFPNLAPGEYELSISAEGFATNTSRVTVAAGMSQRNDVSLSAAAVLSAPPLSAPSTPSVEDLGFPTAQTQSNPREQALLDKRSHMLKVHQRLGLVTAAPLLATVFSGSFAGGKSASTNSTGRDVHAALGGLTAGLYFTTAAYAIFAPKPQGTPTRGPIRLHKGLAWIHGPGMILTPILGIMAYDQLNRGEKVHGIASAHAPVAYITAIAYGAAILSVSIKF
jgi:hypothetical protein